MKPKNKASKKYNYTTLLAQFPETEKLFKLEAEESEVQETLPETGFDFDAIEPAAEEIGEEIQDTEIQEPETEGDSLFSAEEVKEKISSAFGLIMPEDIWDAENSEYVLMIDSLGNQESAATFLGLDADADQGAILDAATKAIEEAAKAAALPGRFEVLAQEQEAEQPVQEEGTGEDAPMEEPELVLDEAVESADEAGEEDEEAPADADLVTFDLFYIFKEEDLETLLDMGLGFGGEAEDSFEDIMSNLVEAGHRDTARRIYDILYPTKRH